MTVDNELKKTKSAERELCFVVGPIGKDGSLERKHADLLLNAVIKHVLQQEEFGYTVKRADEDADPGMIGDRILTDIIRAPIVVADLTDLNPNAFYELGIRHSTEKPTIHVAKTGTALPFDNVAHRTIFVDLSDWHSIENARQRLASAARAIKVPGYKVSNPITQANASFTMRQSEDPRDVFLAEMQDRMATIEATLSGDIGNTHVEREILSASMGKFIKDGQLINAINAYRVLAGASVPESTNFIEALKGGKIIEAIKIHRSVTGLGLKESKDFCEIIKHEMDLAQ